MIDILIGHVINNNVHAFSRSILQSYHVYKDNCPEGSNFTSASARGWRYFKIDIFAPEFTPQVFTHTREKILSES